MVTIYKEIKREILLETFDKKKNIFSQKLKATLFLNWFMI